ncbi:MAG: NAD-dependent epimerase/dehydratase family protein [Mariprofundaceae bacterium]
MRLALTGATGFIGGRLLSLVGEQGADIVALGRRAPDGVARFVHWDMADGAPSAAVLEGADVVFHLAGKAHALSETGQDETAYFRINTEGTRRLLEAAKAAGVRRFVYFSSVKALDEDTPYARSKKAAESLVLDGGFVPEPVVLRPAMVYGPTTKGNLPRMIEAVAAGRFPPIPEFGNRRAMVHVADVASAAWLAGTKPEAAGRVFHVTDGEPYSTRRIYEWICEALGRPLPRWSVPAGALRMLARVGDGIGRMRGRRFVFDSDTLEKLAGSAWYANDALVRELGWRPAHRLRESLPEIIAFLRGQGRIR